MLLGLWIEVLSGPFGEPLAGMNFEVNLYALGNISGLTPGIKIKLRRGWNSSFSICFISCGVRQNPDLSIKP